MFFSVQTVPDKPSVVHYGINAATAAVFIAGEMAGSGVLALPRALVDAGEQISRALYSPVVTISVEEDQKYVKSLTRIAFIVYSVHCRLI